MGRNRHRETSGIPRDQETGCGGAPFECKDLPVVEVLSGNPIECIDVKGKRIDVTLMTKLGVNAKGAFEVIDNGNEECVEKRYRHYRLTSDAAQVIASYLVCHPRVLEVRYPGLKSDPSFNVAARTLQGGFGPIVDYRMDDGWHRLVATEVDVRDQVMDLERKLGVRS